MAGGGQGGGGFGGGMGGYGGGSPGGGMMFGGAQPGGEMGGYGGGMGGFGGQSGFGNYGGGMGGADVMGGGFNQYGMPTGDMATRGGYGGGMGGYGGMPFMGGYGGGMGGFSRGLYNPFRGGFGGMGGYGGMQNPFAYQPQQQMMPPRGQDKMYRGPQMMQMPQNLMPINVAATPNRGPQMMQMPQNLMPINVAATPNRGPQMMQMPQDVMPINVAATPMRSGGIASLRYADGGKASGSTNVDFGPRPAPPRGVSGNRPGWAGYTDPMTGLNMYLGTRDRRFAETNRLAAGLPPLSTQLPPRSAEVVNSPKYADFYSKLDPNIRQYYDKPGQLGTAAGEGSGGGGIQPKGLTKPLWIPPGSKEGVDGTGDTVTPTPTDPTPYTPKPTPLGISGDYNPYTPPPREIYRPQTYAYKPQLNSILGRNTPPEILPMYGKPPARLVNPEQSFGKPFLYHPPSRTEGKPK